MNPATFILLIVLLCCSDAQVTILQSSTTTTIVSPAGKTAVVSTHFNSLKGGIAGAGVNWIQSSSPTLGTTVYQSLFYANCIGNATLTITASNSFNAYLDGVFIGSGSDYTKAFTFPINISCGNHNFTVRVTATTLPSGLTFALKQDQSKCFNCQATGFWSELKCACLCVNQPNSCNCTAPKVWKGYPVCGCGCPSIGIRVPPVSATAEANVDARPTTAPSPAPEAAPAATAAAANLSFNFCLAPRYYSKSTCKCVCHYKYCGPKEYFDENTCSCWPIIY